MRKVALSLAVLSTFLLLVTPALAQSWQTFYLDPSDPHFIKIEDPKGVLKDERDRWIINGAGLDPRPKIYFKIPEFCDKGGYIKFCYAPTFWQDVLYLYASKDGSEYVLLWKRGPGIPPGKTENIIEIPPGYKYFYFYIVDDPSHREYLILWKKIQFKVRGTPPSHIPTPSPVWKTFYLDPKDPRWLKKVDPWHRLEDQGDKWYSNCGHKKEYRPRIYFKIPEFEYLGGYIKFYYARTHYIDRLYLYASKDGYRYVKLWETNMVNDPLYDKIEVTVEVPPGYQYFYFLFRDGDSGVEVLWLWKKILFKVGASFPVVEIRSVDIKGYTAIAALGAGVAVLIYLLTRIR